MIGEVAENDQKSWESMMKAILEEVAFRSDEEMSKKSAKVLSKLNDVEDFHL